MFAAFGTASPFLPGLLREDGLSPELLGVVLAGGSAIRLVAGPVGGRLADRAARPAMVLASFTAAAAVIGLGYAPARGFLLLLLVSIAHAAVLAPLTPVADALALGSAAAAGGGGFAYGWVRGAGSAAFIAGALISGQAVASAGLGVIIWLNAGLLLAAAGMAALVPNRLSGIRPAGNPRPGQAGMRDLLAIPAFRRVMIVAALVGGSHAMHDSFEVIRWRAAGLSAQQASLLWALSVAAEVLMFLLLGRRLLRRLGPAGALVVASAAGMVRWGAAAVTAWFPVMVLIEPLHGLTFALLHLACMDAIARSAPVSLAARAQAFYATVAMGAATTLVTLVSGPIYSRFGAGGFWAMAALCAVALPVGARVRIDDGAGEVVQASGHGAPAPAMPKR